MEAVKVEVSATEEAEANSFEMDKSKEETQVTQVKPDSTVADPCKSKNIL